MSFLPFGSQSPATQGFGGGGGLAGLFQALMPIFMQMQSGQHQAQPGAIGNNLAFPNVGNTGIAGPGFQQTGQQPGQNPGFNALPGLLQGLFGNQQFYTGHNALPQTPAVGLPNIFSQPPAPTTQTQPVAQRPEPQAGGIAGGQRFAPPSIRAGARFENM